MVTHIVTLIVVNREGLESLQKESVFKDQNSSCSICRQLREENRYFGRREKRGIDDKFAESP